MGLGMRGVRTETAPWWNCVDRSKPMDRIQRRQLDRRDRLDLYCNPGRFVLAAARTASLKLKRNSCALRPVSQKEDMKDPKTTLRYLGFRPLPSGARCLDFSLGDSEAVLRKITVEAPKDLFSGPERVSLQECAGICYETLKCRVIGSLVTLPSLISLTSSDVSQHRKHGKSSGRATTRLSSADYR